MKRPVKDRKGGSELIAFLLILPLFLLPLWTGFYSFVDIHKYDILKQTARQALLRMEGCGGLGPADYEKVVAYLAAHGFAEDKILIDYTPYPVAYGEDVAVKISYAYKKVRFTLGLTGLQRIEADEVMVCGPLKSTSKHYER